MEELDEYKPSKFLEAHRDFFKDYCFKFEGLSEDHEKAFRSIIKDLGGKVSRNAKFTLVEKSYFEKIENFNRKDLYYLHFLLDSVYSEEIPDIELYRCIKTNAKSNNKNKENSSSLLQRKVNCNKSVDSRSGGNNVLQESNSTTDELEQLNQVNLQDNDKKLTKNTTKLKRKIPCIELSSDDDESVTKTVKQSSKKKSKYCYDYDSEKKIVNVEREPPSSDNSSSCEMDDELLIEKKITVEPNVKIENREDLQWLFAVDKNNLCPVEDCTFDPGDHSIHSCAGRNISGDEKRVIFRYLIKNDKIGRAKGNSVWEMMNKDGFLTHRSAETLRNSLRRVILPNLDIYNFPPDILKQFLKLQDKKPADSQPW